MAAQSPRLPDDYTPGSAADGDVLAYDAGKQRWVPSDIPTSGTLDATSQPAGHVPTAQGDDTWDWQAQPGGGTGGTTDHSALSNRDAPDQHPIGAVTGLQDALDGKVDSPSHQSILASGNVTLPTEHPVLTIRADDPATLAVPEAPDGTVVTIHVAHGWENLTWGPSITVTGDSTTTETWVVLVRAEGAWEALVSASGDSGVSVVQDTGMRDLNGLISQSPVEFEIGDSSIKFVVSRLGNLVQVNAMVWTLTPRQGAVTVLTLPVGFRPRAYAGSSITLLTNQDDIPARVRSEGGVSLGRFGLTIPQDTIIGMSGTYITTDPWPETLPGVPAA